ncbi:hypothetical protein D3C72_1385220 [compost metagenome]
MGATQGLGETLTDQQRLRGMLEDDGISRHQRRDDRVDRRQVRVIPRGDHQHSAQWLTFDQPSKPVDGRGFVRRQCVRCNGDHMPCTLLETAQFASAEAHRATHLPGQFRDDFSFHGQHRVHRSAAKRRAFA